MEQKGGVNPMRDRLVELLRVPIYPKEGADPAEVVADYLLDNGVIVPPCMVGDTVYYLDGEYYDDDIDVCEHKIVGMTLSDEHKLYFFVDNHLGESFGPFDENDLGKIVFLTRKEAEQALKGGESDA